MASDTITLSVQGMTCGSCVAHLTEALKNVTGVERVEVDLAGARATITVAEDSMGKDALLVAVNEAGYTATVL